MREKGFTLLEILIVLAIMSILTGIGVSSMIQFGHSQALISESYLVKNRLKKFQNMSINMSLEGDETTNCGSYCNDDRWLYGILVDIDPATNSVKAMRVFRDANTGDSDRDKELWREPGPLPSSFDPSKSEHGNYLIDDSHAFGTYEIQEGVDMKEERQTGDGLHFGGDESCRYVFFTSVNGRVIPYNRNNSSVDKCIVYLESARKPNELGKGLMYSKGQSFVDMCENPFECEDIF